MIRRKRHFSVERLEPKIRQHIQREWLDSGVSHEDFHKQLCREFFLPLFERVGFCLLSGTTPAEINPHAGKFQAAPHEVGWEIRTKVGKTGEFPYWRPALGLPLYQLLVPVDLQKSVSTMEQMLGRAWDPIVSTNPHAFFLAKTTFDFVMKTTARSANQVWLQYSVIQHTLRVVLFGSGGTMAGLYGTALREANIAENYYGRYYGRGA